MGAMMSSPILLPMPRVFCRSSSSHASISSWPVRKMSTSPGGWFTWIVSVCTTAACR